ncbi:hypothetical protein CYMTET_29532 [Cymbomonas tetramitiformis]|uniref:Uncharacterized protein n=1 Tax=Cymbomonas tetramitiformis TaxID=36881 RepID=A0AAE0KUU2_9CHLO|nr:hypothetical protein CYMTET_29532 [Cymbomonas tetramitiformis]
MSYEILNDSPSKLGSFPDEIINKTTGSVAVQKELAKVSVPTEQRSKEVVLESVRRPTYNEISEKSSKWVTKDVLATIRGLRSPADISAEDANQQRNVRAYNTAPCLTPSAVQIEVSEDSTVEATPIGLTEAFCERIFHGKGGQAVSNLRRLERSTSTHILPERGRSDAVSETPTPSSRRRARHRMSYQSEVDHHQHILGRLVPALERVIETRNRYKELGRYLLFVAFYIAVLMHQCEEDTAQAMVSSLEQALVPEDVVMDNEDDVIQWLDKTVANIWKTPVCGNGLCEKPYERPFFGRFGCKSDCGTELEQQSIVVEIKVDVSRTPQPSVTPLDLLQRISWNLCLREVSRTEVGLGDLCWYPSEQKLKGFTFTLIEQFHVPPGDWFIRIKNDYYKLTFGRVYYVSDLQEMPVSPLWTACPVDAWEESRRHSRRRNILIAEEPHGTAMLDATSTSWYRRKLQTDSSGISLTFDNDVVGQCPIGWTCNSTASVQSSAAYIDGATEGQFLHVGDGTETSMANSTPFTMPSGISYVKLQRGGGADGPSSGFHVMRSSDNTVYCSATNGRNSNGLSNDYCTGLGSYAGEAAYMCVVNTKSSGSWNHVFIDTIQFMSSSGSELAVAALTSAPTHVPTAGMRGTS